MGDDEETQRPLTAGAEVRSGAAVPASAAWQLEGHGAAGCPAGEERPVHALTRGRPAPPCPGCGEPVTWRLLQLAPSAAPIDPDPGDRRRESDSPPRRQGTNEGR